MEILLRNILLNSSVNVATEQVINAFLKSPDSFEDVKSTINAYVIFNKYYYETYEQIYNKLVSSCSRQDLRQFLDIFTLNYKIEQKDIVDSSDIYLLYHLKPINFMFQLYTSKINSFCYAHSNNFKLKNDLANKYKLYDFLRRMKILRFNFQQIFKIYNLYRCSQLTEDDKIFLDFFLNAIYPNMVSILDSMAFILQFEFNIIPNIDLNNPIDLGRISLFNSKFLLVLKETPINIFQKWFNEIKQLRHAMVHRIPYYNVQMLGDEETELFNRKQKELGEMSIKYLCEFDKIKQKYDEAIKTDINVAQNILNELNKTAKENDEKIKTKHEEMTLLGPFTGIFTDDVEKNQLHHISRILLDIQKMFLVIDIIINYISEKKTLL